MIRFNKPNDDPTEQWMKCPPQVVNYPGLAYIYDMNKFIVAKKLDKLHDVIGLTPQTIGYTVYNSLGEKVFIAVKISSARQYHIKIFNNYGNEVIQITKPSNCFFDKLQVWSPPENFVGSVEKGFCDKYEVKNKDGMVVLIIKATGLNRFIYSLLLEGEEVGVVMAKWADVPYDNFGVTFPMDLEVGLKAVVLGACFLIGGLRYQTYCW